MIAVVGLGYVGLTTALAFAEKGFQVSGFDVAPDRRQTLRAGRVKLDEPDLDKQLARHLGSRFRVCDSMGSALSDAEVAFVCVGTPRAPTGAADLEPLRGAVDAVVQSRPTGKPLHVVIKSTVPPGTTADLARAFAEDNQGLTVSTNPEFLREGHAWADMMEPDRIVVGTEDPSAEKALRRIYAPFGAPIHIVSPTTAEFTKYLSNALLAALISFSNSMAEIAEALPGVDVQKAFRVLHEDRRWTGSPAAMSSYAYPGCGFGGYCLPKDLEAITETASRLGVDTHLLDSIMRVNRSAPRRLAEKIQAVVGREATVGILGLSFKPGSGDVRESPSVMLIEELRQRGFGRLIAHDPVAGAAFMEMYDLPVRVESSLDMAIEKADVLVLATAWPVYLNGMLENSGKPVIDGRYVLPAWRARGPVVAPVRNVDQ